MKKIILLIVILAITFGVYSPILKAEFTNWDDQHFILNNPSVLTLDWDHIVESFKKTYVRVYVPLTVLMWAIEHHFFGFDPLVYHLNNLLLHMAVTALVFVFAQRLGLHLWAAAIAALLYGVHPIHAESVCWVTERKDVLFAFFYMCALLCYWKYLDKNKKSSYVLSILFGLLSILSKPTALSLPLTFAVLDWFKGRRLNSGMILDKIPHFAYIIPITLKTLMHHTEITTEVIPGETLSEAIPIFFWTFSFYIQKLLWPLQLVPQYQLPLPISITQWPYILAVIVFVAYAVLLWRYRKNRWFMFSFLFFMSTIFFLIRYGTFVRYSNVVADRHMYIPSVGFCLFLGWLFYEIVQKAATKGRLVKSAAFFSLAAVIALLSVKTFSLSKIWQNSVTYWSYVIEHNPLYRASAYAMRGYAHVQRQKWALAIEDSDKAIAMNPYFGRAYMIRGIAYSYQGKNYSALDDFTKAIQYKPTPMTYINRANVYVETGELEKAIDDTNEALKAQSSVIEANYAKAYAIRGRAYGIKGDYDLAVADLNQSIYLNPYDHLVYYDRGFFHSQQGKYDLAITDYNKALALKPDDFGTLDQRGSLFYIMEKYDLAEKDFNKVLSLNPGFARGYNNRGSVHLAKGRDDRALDDFNEAIALDNNYAMAYMNRSVVHQERSEYDKALRDALKAQSLGADVDEDYIDALKQKVSGQ